MIASRSTLAPFKFKSIITRIICLHVIAVGVISVLMPLLLYWLLDWETDKLHQEAMRQQASKVAQHLAIGPDERWTLELPRDLQALFSEDYGRYAYAIVDGSGRVLFSSLKGPVPLFPADARAPGAVFLQARRGDLALSGASLPNEIAGRRVWVQVAENLAHRDVIIDDIVAAFLQSVGWITLPILLLLVAVDIVIFRRALLPLVRASQQARSIGPARTDIRLPVDGMPREVLPLVQSVNQALDRLEHGFSVQREFTADAAHELRTPLTVLRTRIDTLADQSTAQAVRQDIEAISRVINQLLDIAELDTYVVDRSGTADLHEICSEVVEFIAPLAVMQGKDIALHSVNGPVWVIGDREMLYRGVRNLVENAINHTPRGATVEIVVEAAGKVMVLDDGPGIREAHRELMFRRFWRADRRRAGAGLGLAIVQRIAQAHGGTVTVDNRPEGGAQFTLQLLLADRSRIDAPATGEGRPNLAPTHDVVAAPGKHSHTASGAAAATLATATPPEPRGAR